MTRGGILGYGGDLGADSLTCHQVPFQRCPAKDSSQIDGDETIYLYTYSTVGTWYLLHWEEGGRLKGRWSDTKGICRQEKEHEA